MRLRRPAALEEDPTAPRRRAEDRRPRAHVRLLDRACELVAVPRANVAYPAVSSGDECRIGPTRGAHCAPMMRQRQPRVDDRSMNVLSPARLGPRSRPDSTIQSTLCPTLRQPPIHRLLWQATAGSRGTCTARTWSTERSCSQSSRHSSESATNVAIGNGIIAMGGSYAVWTDALLGVALFWLPVGAYGRLRSGRRS